MKKVDLRPADFPLTESKSRFDLPVVLSLAGIVSVAAVIGATAFRSEFFSDATGFFAGKPAKTITATKDVNQDLKAEVARLSTKLEIVSAQLKKISLEQNSTAMRIAKFDESFGMITAAIPKTEETRSYSYDRLLDTGWRADDMVTRKRKRDRMALLKSDANITSKPNSRFSAKPTSTQFAVELSSYENITTARVAWQKLVERHGLLLDKLAPRMLPVANPANKMERVQLMVGPIKNAAKAASVCAILRSEGNKCLERVFSSKSMVVVSVPEIKAVKPVNSAR